jgi:hypothetical protein
LKAIWFFCVFLPLFFTFSLSLFLSFSFFFSLSLYTIIYNDSKNVMVTGTEIYIFSFFIVRTHTHTHIYIYEYIKFICQCFSDIVVVVGGGNATTTMRWCFVQYFNVNWHANVPILLILLSIRCRSNLIENVSKGAFVSHSLTPSLSLSLSFSPIYLRV